MAVDAHETLASIDLGSNSFHMLVAKVDASGVLTKIDSMRESVRMAEGLTEDRLLTPESQERALACLARFQQRIAELPRGAVRAAGTNTLRKASNAQGFLAQARKVLGHPIEIISGLEEARLIYLGVAHGHASEGRRFVIDIGGGSTELILGEGMKPSLAESLTLGCVSQSLRFFEGGEITEKRFTEAVTRAKLSILPVFQSFAQGGWEQVLGCSGTIKAIRRIVQDEGWSKSGITLTALYKLREAMIQAGHADALDFKMLKNRRRTVLAGGLAVLLALFEMFGIQHMEVSKQALREGLLYDLIGRLESTDIRGQTIQSFSERWGLDLAHAQRVARTVELLYAQTKESWGLTEPRFSSFLQWAAQLHELGLQISHRQYHRHGSYVLTHADMSGFSFQEQQWLATLVLYHRRKFKYQPNPNLPESMNVPMQRLCVLLRLAVLLCRRRVDESLPPVVVEAKAQQLTLNFPASWMEQHPLLEAYLDKEAKNLTHAQFVLNTIVR